MRYFLLGMLSLITVTAYAQRTALSSPTKLIEADLGIDSDSMGLIMAFWFWGYAFLQIPSGWLADRFGSHRALIGFAAVWSTLTALTGLATGWLGLALLWGLMGCAQAGLFPCCTKEIGASFPVTQHAFASGILAACMGLGAALAQWISPQLLQMMTWQGTLICYAIPGILWVAAFAVISPVLRKNSMTSAIAKKSTLSTTSTSWMRMVNDPQLLILCLQQFLRAGGVAFFYTWFPRFLVETRGLTTQEAGGLAVWPPLAGMAGGLLGGILSEWVLIQTGNSRLARQGLACVAMLVCAITAGAAYLTESTTFAVILLCAGGFCGVAGGVSAYAVVIAYGGTRVATAFAIMNMSGNLGAGLFPLAVGLLVKHTQDWNLVLILFGLLFLGSAVCWALLNPQGNLDSTSSTPVSTHDQSD